MRRNTVLSHLLTILIAWLLPAGLTTVAQSPEPDVDGDWFAQVTDDIRRAEYHFSWQDGSLQAPNRVNGLRTHVDEAGFEVVSRTAGAEGFRLTLRLAGYGRGTSMVEVEPGRVSEDEGRVEILRNQLVEWLVNDPQGLEHGFTLSAPPEGEGNRVVLALELDGTLTAYPLGTRGVVLKDAGGAAVLRYDGLVVVDASDEELPAWIEMGTDEIRLGFDDRDAVYPVVVDPLLTGASWTRTGAETAGLGTSVRTAGDVNGDGFSDVIVGAPGYDGGTSDEGAIYVYHGSSNGLWTIAHFSIESNLFRAKLGEAVSTAGDVNGDGYDDVIAGAPGVSQCRLYYGSSTGVTSTSAWTTSSQSASSYGNSVSYAGDVNGDGYDDVIVGAPFYDNASTDNGRVFLYYGSSGTMDTTADWAESSARTGVLYGWAVSGAGDVNGDSYDDLIIGAKNYDSPDAGEGRAFIYLGSATIPVYNSGPDSDEPGAEFGTSVAGAGDVNGDGYADVIIGAPLANNGGFVDAGRVDILYGSSSGITETGKTVVTGPQETGAWLGFSVDTAGDVNGDGFADVIVGAPKRNLGQTDEGGAYVLRGSNTGIRPLDYAFGGFEYWIGQNNQASSNYGWSVGPAGDVNGDGFSDVIVGASGYDSFPGTGHGRAYVYLGGGDGLTTSAGWSETDGTGGSSFGHSLAFADVNGDGFSDALVGAPLDDASQVDEGRVYVYHGTPTGPGSTPAVVLNAGEAGAQFGYSVTGADVNGDGFDDVIVGAPFSDWNGSDDGRAYMFNGAASGVINSVSWANQTGSGVSGARLGFSVANAGDVNGDGYADVILGAPRHSNGQSQEGGAWIFHGSADGLGFGAADRILEVNDSLDQFGYSVSGAGDINGDGYADVIVGAPYGSGLQSGAGKAYVFLGSAGGIPAGYSWTVHGGSYQNSHLGWSVGNAGDFNGDGLSDVIIGQPDFTFNYANEGRFLVYRGQSGGTLAFVGDGYGGTTGARFGYSVSTAGDINNDGYSDVVSASTGSSGLTTVWLGAAAGFPSTYAWGTGKAHAVSTGGDLNGDGFDDVLVSRSDIRTVWGYYGGGGEGLDRIPRQQQPASTSAPRIGLMGKSTGSSSTRLQVRARTAAGRDHVRVEYEVKPLGIPFDGLNTKLSNSELLTSAPASDGSRTNYSTNVGGLTNGPFYHWRIRVLAPRNPLFPSTMWMKYASIAKTEQALKTNCTVITWYPDGDGDGFGDGSGTAVDRCTQPVGYAGNNTDCNDSDSNVNPGQIEQLCDGIDNDCSAGSEDAPDDDTDGYDVCDPSDPGDTDGGAADCDDGNASINPGEDEEICDGIDNDCFANSEDAPNRDNDSADRCDASDPGDTDGLAADCDDFNPQVAPGAPEHKCNGIDENCSGMADDAPDVDGDGYDTCDATDPGDTDGADADCEPSYAGEWAIPGEATNLRLSVQVDETVLFEWNAPTQPGGTPANTYYDMIRSNDATSFEPYAAGATECVFGFINQTSEPEPPLEPTPLPGEVLHYLVVPKNSCGQGSAGATSAGTPRTTLDCAP